MRIHIKRRSQSGWAIWLIIVMPFFLALINQLLGISRVIYYLIDVAWVFSTVLLFWNQQLFTKHTKQFTFFTFCFLGYTSIMYVIQFKSPLYYLWGVRNNFRYYFAFLSLLTFSSSRDVEGYFTFFTRIFWLNIMVTLVQYFIFGYNYDLLGGVFGVERGVNGYTNIYLCIMVTWMLVRYMEKKSSLMSCAAICTMALMVAAMAELKFFFVEFIMIVGLSALFTNFSLRKIMAVLGALLAVVLFAALLVIIFPHYEGFLSVDFFLEAATSDKGYTSSGDLNRLTALAKINELWLTTNFERLFGFGLGNCETASYAFLNTPFFESYGHMHYTWLSHAFMYLECGWIGLIFYFGFFVLVYFKATRIQNRVSGDGVTYCRLARIMAILCAIISVYNSSLRMESGYMAYFVLSVPFIYDREYQLQREIAQLNGSVQLSI